MQAALFAYNHSSAYVTQVLDWAARYAAGGAQAISAASSPLCQQAALGPLPAGTAGKVIAYAEAQIGKPYQWGATGPGAFDCSGLTMMAYRAAGISHPPHQPAAMGLRQADPRQPGETRRPGLLRRLGRHHVCSRPCRHRHRRPRHDDRRPDRRARP